MMIVLRQMLIMCLLACVLGALHAGLRGATSLAAPDPQTAVLAMAAGMAQAVDARSEADFTAGHVAGAIHLPADDPGRSTDRMHRWLVPDQPVVVYCSGGPCSAAHEVATLLRANGFETVTVLSLAPVELRQHLDWETGAWRD